MASSATVLDRDPELPDDDYIRRALKSCNLNALRIALYYQTGDPELAAVKVDHIPVQGGALIAHSVARESRDMIREKAFAFIKDMPEIKPPPSREEARKLMTLFTGYEPTEGEADFGYEDLAFDEFPRDVSWKGEVPKDKLKDFNVLIVGAGFSGIAAAIQLDRLGIKNSIVERLGDVGGTWEVNDYPEARVDISNFLYQYKFVKNYPWKSYFAPRDELKEYIDYVVDEFDLRDRIALNTAVESARWDESEKLWHVTLRQPDGSLSEHTANIVFSCAGLFNMPNLPDIDGIEDFKGEMFHTTNWNHDYDMSGKRIALIGTGSTGSQLLPALARDAEHVTVFQRTPQWVMPINGYHETVSDEKHWLLRTFPGYWNWFIYSNYIGSMQVQKLQDVDPEWEAKGGTVNERNDALRQRLIDFIREETKGRDDLFEKLVPEYPPLTRRLVIDNAFYKTLMRDNVDLETNGIDRIVEDGIVTKDGTHHKFDLIVLSAGFKVSQYLWPVNYHGRDGVSLEDVWGKDGARAYLSVTMPHYPNFFMFYGPTSQVRGGSFHSWQEVTTRYICQLIVEMIERGASEVEVRPDVFEEYNRAMDAEFPKLLWRPEKGGRGYFYNEHGRLITNMPWSTDTFYSWLKQADPDHYEFR